MLFFLSFFYTIQKSLNLIIDLIYAIVKVYILIEDFMEIIHEDKLMPLKNLKMHLNMTLCSCLTKTPVLEYHLEDCHYRVAHEALFRLNKLLKEQA